MIGIPDDYRGQSPKAFVKLKDGAAPTDARRAAGLPARTSSASTRWCRRSSIRAELPKTPVGKLSKKELYEEEAEEACRGADRPEDTAMSTSPFPDPFQLWREALSKLEGNVNSLRHRQHGLAARLMRSVHQLSALSLGMQQAFEKAIGAYLAKVNLPSRKDVTELAAALQRIEDKLDRLLPATAAAAPALPRPARTRRRPAQKRRRPHPGAGDRAARGAGAGQARRDARKRRRS